MECLLNLCSILALIKSVIFWRWFSDVARMGFVSPSLGITAPFISPSPFISSVASLSVFGMSQACYAACPQLLLYVWLAITCLSVCIWKSHRIFAWLFSSIFRGGAHFDLGTSSPYSVQMYSIVCQLYLVMYTLATSILPQVTTTHLCSGSKRHHRPSSTGCVSDLLCSGVEPRAPGKSIHAEYKRMW